MMEWAHTAGLSWDEDNQRPEPICSDCDAPINIWDGKQPCPECDDCESCCDENHAGEPHPRGV